MWEERGAALEAAGEEAARRLAEYEAERAEHAAQLSSLRQEVRQQAELALTLTLSSTLTPSLTLTTPTPALTLTLTPTLTLTR